jgi:dTDP-4-amino-4,6-dideoxygalactose transaminase
MHKIKFVDLGSQYRSLRKEILAAFDRVSGKGAYILGEEVEKFEREFADFCGTKYAVGVANGSDALYLSLVALGIGAGDEVITAPNSFLATAWAILRAGAEPVFVDVGEDMNIDPALIEKACTKRTRAIMPVHLTGRVADMNSIMKVANRRRLYVIEDAAQAVGARYRGKSAGAFGVCAGFSLHPLKNLHVHGDGGVITTSNKALHARLLMLRNHGLLNRDICNLVGINSRLDAVQAAIARIKLKHLEKWNKRMRFLAAMYTEGLRGFVTVPGQQSHEEPCYHRYMIRLKERDRLKNYLARQGIETKVNYPVPIHLQPAAKILGYKAGDFPVAEKLARTILSLPLYPEMKNTDVWRVIVAIKKFLSK